MATQPPSHLTDPSAAGPETAGPAFSPLYQQIKALITRSLQAGEWKPGEAIPSEVELAARFKVSQGTVRKAIDELAAENLLVRRQGKGTFVATHAEEKVQYRFLRLTPDDGDTGPVQRRFIDCRRLRAPAEVARALDLKSGDAALQIRRLLLFKGKPVVFDDIWLHGGLFKGLTAERLSEYRGPMYALFETEFGVRDDPRRGKAARGGRRCHRGRAAAAARGHAAAERGAAVADLRGPPGGIPPRALQHGRAFLSQ